MNNFSELLRRVEITCKARYHGARRLAFHHWMSQWTLALLAVGQIVIALVVALELRANFPPEYVAFGSIFFAILVLTYSLLLGMGNYSARAVKLHGCGLELGRLARNLYQLQSNPQASLADYHKATRLYYNILEKHENHTRADYLRAHYEYYSSRTFARMPGEGSLAFLRRWAIEQYSPKKAQLGALAQQAIQFSHYVISAGLIWTWIYLLVR